MAVQKLTEKSLVKVINNTRGSLSFRDVNDRKHLFPKPNSYKNIELSIIVNLYNDYQNFIEDGYIVFEDLGVYDYLGVPQEIYSKLIPLDKIEEYLQKDADELRTTLKDVPSTIKENIAMVAKDMNIDSKKKVKAIKDVTGFDVENREE